MGGTPFESASVRLHQEAYNTSTIGTKILINTKAISINFMPMTKRIFDPVVRRLSEMANHCFHQWLFPHFERDLYRSIQGELIQGHLQYVERSALPFSADNDQSLPTKKMFISKDGINLTKKNSYNQRLSSSHGPTIPGKGYSDPKDTNDGLQNRRNASILGSPDHNHRLHSKRA